MSLMTALGMDRLPFEERAKLVEEILASLDDEAESAPFTESQLLEIDRRLAALDADPSSARPWEEVKARLLARLPS